MRGSVRLRSAFGSEWKLSLGHLLVSDGLVLLVRRIKQSDQASRLASGVLWSAVGSVASRGLLALAMVGVARTLGKDGFGQFGMVQSTVAMLGAFAGASFSLTATKHVAQFRETDKERAARIMFVTNALASGVGALFAIALYAEASWLASTIMNEPQLTTPLRIGSLVLLCSAATSAQTGALTGLEAFRTISVVNLVAGLLSVPILIAGAVLGGVDGAVAAVSANLAVMWLLNHLALRQETRRLGLPRLTAVRGWMQEWKTLAHFSLPTALGTLVVAPALWAPRALLANQPAGYAELGIFAAASMFQMPIILMAGTVGAPLLSMIASSSSESSARLGILNMLASWCIGVGLGLPLLAFPEIANLIFGQAFEGEALRVTFTIVVFYTIIITYRHGLARALALRDMQWWGLLDNVVWMITLFVASIPLAPYGAVGIAMAFAIAYLGNTIAFVLLFRARGLVPPGTMLSWDAGAVWLAVIANLLLGLMHASLVLRGSVLFVSLVVVAAAFLRLACGPRCEANMAS